MISDLLSLIPNNLKQQVLDSVVDIVASQAESVGGSSMAQKIRQLRSDAAFTSAYENGLKKAVERFIQEYGIEDEDLVSAVSHSHDLFTNHEVQSALLSMVSHPGKYLNAEQETLIQSFDSVLPQRKNRERVDKAISYLLRCLAEEMWHLPELQPIYTLQFARMTAEATHEQVALQKAQLAALSSLGDGVRNALLQLTDSITSQKQLTSDNTGQQLQPPKVYHNLPQPDYGEFVGRKDELAQIFNLLQPHPQSRHHLIVIDGIGGIGKSTLALEVAHRCLHASMAIAQADKKEQDRLVRLRETLIDRLSEDELRTLCFDLALDYEMLPGQGKGGKARELVAYMDRRNRLAELFGTLQRLRPDTRDDAWQENMTNTAVAEQFDAIIWTSAKNNVLTADGIIARRQVLRTLDDIYTAISIALQRDDITRASGEQQDQLVRRALTQQRTLLIIDNLETVDDSSVITFLQELPDPTKAIVTTRHRIDVAYPVRLGDMPWIDAQKLINIECEEKQVTLTHQQAQQLYARTGGVPLAITWSIAQIGFGYPIETVLKRLSQPQENIARFCFDEAISLIRKHPARRLLLALSLFEAGATRQILGQVTGQADDVLMRDEGLVQLERLSLVNKENGRFTLLPLTRDYATAERLQYPDENHELVENWLAFYVHLVQKDGSNHARWYNFDVLTEEGQNILAAVDWAFAAGRIHEALVLMTAVFWYLDITGRWTDALKYGDKAIELAALENDNLALAGICRQTGWIKAQLGQFDAAETYFQQGVAAVSKVSGKEGVTMHTDLLIVQGQAIRKAGDYQQAKDIFQRCQEAIDTHQLASEVQADLNFEWGKWARDQQDWAAAQHYFQRVLDWSEQMVQQKRGYQYDMALGTQGNMAFILFQLGQYAEARSMCQRAMQFYEKQGGKPYYAILNYRFALIEEALGNIQSARDHAQYALQIAQLTGLVVELPIMQALINRLQAE
ncbi:MAG: tetratricopeptide repeat protein [Ardenticatenaceae bacterium]|nr:tetratricopeptide repeat protein [Ardenticatenaceae bacterium]